MSMAHQHIVRKLNRRAEVERENQRMAEIEKHATPLFYVVFGAAIAVILWTATADYRDVWQHKLDTMADRKQYERVNATLASCANGAVVSFDDGLMTCRIKRLVVMK
ncbi:MAG: hypothetical protein A2V79_05500 [Betaproteobacteria bacterium RBG_16_56_24]|nr:MAG: hypothetical protein A2V79_05500 [Betaproteobacteria bacterium RBG_16_56_24]